jgi:hypothetical protein
MKIFVQTQYVKCMHVHAIILANVYIHTHMHQYTLTCMYSRMHACTRTHAHTHAFRTSQGHEEPLSGQQCIQRYFSVRYVRPEEACTQRQRRHTYSLVQSMLHNVTCLNQWRGSKKQHNEAQSVALPNNEAQSVALPNKEAHSYAGVCDSRRHAERECAVRAQ